jgi:hypothetical protein
MMIGSARDRPLHAGGQEVGGIGPIRRAAHPQVGARHTERGEATASASKALLRRP